MASKPDVPESLISKWQRVVDLTARLVHVPSSLIMKTDPPNHAVLVSSAGAHNPYRVGMSFELNRNLYCYSVLQNRGELLVRNAWAEPDWCDNQDLEHGMSFYIGYPLQWPDGTLFGTICVLDRRENKHAILHRDLLQEFCNLIEGDLALLSEMAERRRLESQLNSTLASLEARVEERTRELTALNRGLHREIAGRKRVEAALRRRERQLEDANIALRVVLAQVEASRRALERQIRHQITGLVTPHISRLKQSGSCTKRGRAYIELLEINIELVASSLGGKLISVFERLTPTETEVAQMVMAGKSTKDIAEALSREPSTIDFHRNNIRKKLGLDNSRRNLRSHLLSLH